MYILYQYVNNSWIIFKAFASKSDFLVFLARDINKRQLRGYLKECPYMEGLNLTMKDRKHVIRYEYVRDVDGNIQWFEYGPSIKVIHEWQMYPYHVKDADGRTVDIRSWMPEIQNIISAQAWPRTKKEQHGRSSHHHARGRRVLEVDESYDDFCVELLTAGQQLHLHVRPKLVAEGKYYGGPFYSVNSSGWKNRKNEKQWTAKQLRVSDATYVCDISKRAIADMMNHVDEVGGAYS